MGCSTVRGDAVVRLLAAAFVACWVAGCGSAQSSASSAPASNGPVTTAAAIGSAPVASEAPPQTLTRIPVQHVVAGPFALDAPGAWHVGPPTYLPNGTATYALLSPQTLSSLCVESASGGVCGAWPDMRLDPGSVVVAIRSYGMPGSSPPAGGDPITVAGRAARELTSSADEACRAIGGSRSTQVAFPSGSDGGSGWLSIEACAAAPEAAADAAVGAIVASASFPADRASPS